MMKIVIIFETQKELVIPMSSSNKLLEETFKLSKCLPVGVWVRTKRRAGMSALVRDICLCFGQSGSRGLL